MKRKLFVDRIKKILWITFAWTLVSLMQFAIGYGTIIEMGFDLSGWDILVPLKTSLLIGFLSGTMGGFAVVFWWENWLRSKPYGWTLRSILISFTVIYFLVSFPALLVFQSGRLNTSILDLNVWKLSIERFGSFGSVVSYVFWLLIVLGTMVVMLVNDKYGPGVFKKFLLGKYFNPHREERVFMFLDLRSSTMIAEKLGEEVYFAFLRDVFKYATPGILKYKGEIYQYVGDEIVISWDIRNGTEDANCILCFFEIQELLKKKTPYFQEKYGEIPEFKAGLHYGHVMAGEVGVVKREIAFSGDVLNTTSRIQDQCNKLGVDILASKNLLDRIKKLKERFTPREIGKIPLRGKKELVTLFTL